MRKLGRVRDSRRPVIVRLSDPDRIKIKIIESRKNEGQNCRIQIEQESRLSNHDRTRIEIIESTEDEARDC